MKKGLISVFLSFFIFLCSVFTSDIQTEAAGKNVVVVIDPGHGGEGEKNLGAQYNGFSEKELTLKVANAMKNELEQYENVTVYLTRTEDVKISLEDRAEFAKSVNADFVFSIHFNASLVHEFYGSEIWAPSSGSFYQKGYNFGLIEMNELASLGLYQKGVKTKVGKNGDYYGIIRACVARDIPCDIIEHAYLDHGYDLQLLNSPDFFTKLGVADATAVAKYFKLKSSSKNVDYSKYTSVSVKKPSNRVYQDTSAPEKCSISLIKYDKASRNALIEMSVKDSQSPVIYFSYSVDGGKTFCTLQMWDQTKDTQGFNVNIPTVMNTADIVLRAYNNYELFTQSNEVKIETR